MAKRLHSVPPAKRQEVEDLHAIDEEALSGPDAPPPRRLTPEWVAVNTIIEEAVVRQILPKLKAAKAEGIVEYPLNKIVL